MLDLFLCFSIFSSTKSKEKTVGFGRIQTRIVGVEGEWADHTLFTDASFVIELLK